MRERKNQCSNLAATFARGRSMIAAATVVLVASSAWADVRTYVASNDPDQSSSFSLDFGVELGGARTANITRTTLELAVNDTTGEASFVRYMQDVDPIILPGDISTGDLRIEIVPGSSTGTYDSVSGVFSTDETYRIYFAGDLSAYGLISPVELPSASTGTIIADSNRTGSIGFDWEGEGVLSDPTRPGEFISFAYTCNIAVVYGRALTKWSSAVAGAIGELRADALVTDALLGQLDLAALEARMGDTSATLDSLQALIEMVDGERGFGLYNWEADAIIDSVDLAIEKVAPAPTTTKVKQIGSIGTR